MWRIRSRNVKTNLAYIGEAAGTAASLERMKTVKTIVAGFEIELPAEKDYRFEEKRKSFVHDAANIKSKLAAIGVEPLAIVPEAWWTKIVEESGMHNITPDSDGMLPLHMNGIENLTHGREAVMVILPSVAVGALIPALICSAIVSPWWVAIPVGAFGAFCTFGFLASNNGFGLIEKLQARRFLREKGEVAALKSIMSTTDRYTGYSTKITLPEPPTDVIEILRKMAGSGMVLSVAAVQGAVGFNPPLEEVITKKLLKKGADRRQEIADARARARSLDPIIFTKSGSAVAIVAQFGDFPIEKEVVDTVVQNFGL